MKGQNDPIIEILKKEFAGKQERNSSYSLRAFSSFLDIDASNLSKIMNYNLTAGERLKKKIASKLGIASEDFMKPLAYYRTKDKDYREHTLNVFHIISDWYHYALLELLKLKKYKNAKPNNKSMAKDIGISQREFTAAVGRLISAGLLSVNKSDGSMINTEENSSTILKVNTSKAHRNHQKQILEKAIDALECVAVDERSQTSMTMAVSKSKLPQAVDMITDFRRQLARFLSSDKNDLDEVYHLSISLYPITKTLTKENKL